MRCPKCDTAKKSKTMDRWEASPDGVIVSGYGCDECLLSLIDLDASDFGGALWTNIRQAEIEEGQEPLTQLVLWLKGKEQELVKE